MRAPILVSTLFLGLAAAAGSCGSDNGNGGGTGGASGGTGGAGGSSQQFTAVQAIFSGSCIFCHNGSTTDLPGAQDLRPGMSRASIVGVDSVECASMGGRKRIAPGDPANSYLLDKVKGIDLCAGTQMPPSGSPLSTDQIAAIEAWIAAGAP